MITMVTVRFRCFLSIDPCPTKLRHFLNPYRRKSHFSGQYEVCKRSRYCRFAVLKKVQCMPTKALVTITCSGLSSDAKLQPQRSNLYVDNLKSGFVPPSSGFSLEDVGKLQDFLAHSQHLFVLTGAGLSTESGIPDYRSEGVGLYARSNHRPMNYQEFLRNVKSRQRYWARNYTGWPMYSSFQPNFSHMTVSRWEAYEKLHWLVTQNVDALHVKAGNKNLTELHGSLYRVVCLSCKNKITRKDFQVLLQSANPHWNRESVEIAPDGDVQLSAEQVEGFLVPPCQTCGGVLKPDIVFFGDNVPRDTVHFVFDKLQESDAVLVLGSSLQVYSAYRFISRAKDLGLPIAVVNIGPTRADALVDLKIQAKCSEVLKQIVRS